MGEGEGHEDVGQEGCSDEGYEEGDEKGEGGERGRSRLAGVRDEEVKGHEEVGYEGRGDEESDEEGEEGECRRVGVERGDVGHGEEGRLTLGSVTVGGRAGGGA